MDDAAYRKFVEEFRPLLERGLAETDGLIADASGNSATVKLDQQSVGRLSRMDAMQGQALAQAVERRRTQRRQTLIAALKRMEDGEYGYCAACGDEIAPARLKADPTFTQCVACAK